MVIAAFMFLNEFDVLEIFLRETESVVDRYVIVEADRTFTYNPKPFHLLEQRDRFAPWWERFRRVEVTNVPPKLNAHRRDAWNRDCVVRGLQDAGPADTVILCDCDEIPRADAIRGYKPVDGFKSLAMSMHHYYLNVRTDERWIAPKILPGHVARKVGATSLRLTRTNPPVIENAGWHFSSVGGAEQLDYKTKSFAHADQPHHADEVRGVRDGTWIPRFGRLTATPIDETYPKFVRENVPLMRERGLVYDPPFNDA